MPVGEIDRRVPAVPISPDDDMAPVRALDTGMADSHSTCLVDRNTRRTEAGKAIVAMAFAAVMIRQNRPARGSGRGLCLDRSDAERAGKGESSRKDDACQ